MPQSRTLLHRDAALQVERVVMHAQAGAAAMQWSPRYSTPSARLVLPTRGATEFRFGDAGTAGATLLLDGITALSLPADAAYQMKACLPQDRASVVVSACGAAALPVHPGAWLLTPAVLYRLRRHWRALARGDAHAGSGRDTPGTTGQLLAGSLAQPAAHQAPPAVRRAQRFMAVRTLQADACAGARWTLADVADAACCSPFHLARQFRRHTGLSLHAWREHLRLAAALQRLEDGERDLAALAHELGYASQSHWGQALRRAVGVTPAQARAALGSTR